MGTGNATRTHQGSQALGCPGIMWLQWKITLSFPKIILFDHDSFKDTTIQGRRQCAECHPCDCRQTRYIINLSLSTLGSSIQPALKAHDFPYQG